MSYTKPADYTPAQRAAYAAEAAEIKASDARINAANKATQATIDAALDELKAVCEAEGRGTYINPTGEYGGGMYYEPRYSKKYYIFDAEGKPIKDENETDTWENSDAGWQSSNNC